ncbi:hypothetical protein GCM10011363_10970 [Marivita lacus]|uniref:Uncharacterized protein n=1 Tax=Marivita lacus TaxID=1323742 RepID=A0ABQ1KHT1_9RHOB|nr:hypothetical protein GCM10011363_10970 [Marivita lacus]
MFPRLWAAAGFRGFEDDECLRRAYLACHACGAASGWGSAPNPAVFDNRRIPGRSTLPVSACHERRVPASLVSKYRGEREGLAPRCVTFQPPVWLMWRETRPSTVWRE